jgi:hypothetical protein
MKGMIVEHRLIIAAVRGHRPSPGGLMDDLRRAD